MREAAREAVVDPPHRERRGHAPVRGGQDRHGGVRDAQDRTGNLPFDSWFVGFVSPSGNFAKTDSQLAILAFTYDTSQSIGNPSTELVKYFLQMHYGIKKDYRNLFLIQPGAGN